MESTELKEYLIDRFDTLDKNMANLTEQMNKIYKIISKDDDIFIKNIKLEIIKMDIEFVKFCLETDNLKSDIDLCKEMYFNNIEKDFYPIRFNKRRLQYWLDNRWNDDDNCLYIKNTICKNIQNSYRIINIFDNYEDDADKFLSNQAHIDKLSEERYKDKILLNLKCILDKN